MKRFLLLILTAFLSLTAMKAQEAYAVYTENDSTLTFYYDNQKSSRSGTKYGLNTGNNNPGWYTDNRAYIKKAVFDLSFAGARPLSTKFWFAPGYSGSHLSEIVGIEYLNTSEVTHMHGMFDGCSGLTSLDVSHFDTSKVTYMGYMFEGCSGLTSLDITNFDTSKVTDMGGLFSRCSGLTSLDVTHFDTSKVTHMDAMFQNCSGLTSLDVTHFDTSNVTHMLQMFQNCNSLTSLDVTHFVTSKVTHMDGMFWGCSSLTNLDVSHFDTNNVTSMLNMFNGCSDLTNLDVTHFNTSKVTHMSGMFYECSSLTSLDVTHFDTSNVWNMSDMFYYCSSLISLDVTHFNTSKVTNMSSMFYGCSGLTSLDITNFDTSKVTDMRQMFYGCSGLTSLDVTHLNTSKVTDMGYMFQDCTNLSTIYVGEGWNTDKVTTSLNMFLNCNNLVGGMGTKYDANHVDKAYAHIDGGASNPGYLADKNSLQSKEAYAVYTDDGTLTFYYDNQKSSRSGTIYGMNTGSSDPGWYTDHRQDIKKAVFDSSFASARPTSTYRWFACNYKSILAEIVGIEYLNTSEVMDMGGMFGGCSSLTSLDVTHFDTSNVTSMSYMFYGCSDLTSLDLSHFDTSKVTNMLSMFDGCGLTSLDLSHFDTSNVTDMNSMFWKCSSLKSLDLCNFNTSKVTNMVGMFNVCSSLTNLDLSHFDTSKVTNMSFMFQECSGLTTIYVGEGWNTDKITSSDNMFFLCNNLVGGAGTVYDINHTDASYAHIDGGASNPGYLTDKNALQPQEAYAVYTDDGTLTFYYDNQKSSRSGTIYGMNTGDDDPGWYTDHQADIKKAVFDSSFAGARPTSTYHWFASINKSILTEIAGIEHLNTSAVVNMAYMFWRCSGLTSLDVTHFDTSKVTNMNRMFSYCSGLTGLDVTHFDTSKVRQMNSMFMGCSGLTSLDLSHFDTSNVVDMHYMFSYCSGLTSLDVTHFNTNKVIGMSTMFYDCSGLTSLDVSNFNTINVTDMNGIFGGCSGLKSLDVSNFNTSNVTNMGGMFSGCSNLTSLDVTHFDTSLVMYMGSMFGSCSGLTSLDVTHFDTSNVTSMSYMFYGCSGLTSLDVSHFDTSKVTNMSSMFSDCSGLTSLDVTHFDTSKVTDMFAMFDGCSALTSLDVTHFNTSKVTDMERMFNGCSGLTSLDLSNFDTSNVTNMGYTWRESGMFQDCTNLTTIYVGEGWNTDKVSQSANMFFNCKSLVGGMGTKYDANHVDKEYAHIDGGASNPGYLTGKNVSPEPNEEELDGWYTLIDKKMTLNGSPRGEYMILQSDGYLVWNNKADGNLIIKVYIDPDDAYTLRFDSNPDNYLRISDINGNTVTMVAENGITRIFTITEEQEEEPITGNTFKANTVEGIEMLFQIISEADKICQVGTGSEAAISLYTAGIVTIPSEARGYTVTKIANRAFKNCVQLTQVVIPNTITDIGTTEFQSAMGAFHDCKGIVSFDIPTSVTLIGRGTFSGCSTITELKIPESVTVIGSNAFDHCTGMKSIELSPFITAILLETFRDCTSLEYIEIPGSVSSIGYNAFQNCNALKGVTTYIEDPFTFPQSAFTNYSATLYVPVGTKEKYQSTTYWNRFYQIEEFDDAADALTFTTSKGLTYTVIHRGNTVSVKAASIDLSGEVTIPEVVMNNGKRYTVVTIRSGAFEGCSGLEKLKIAKTVTNIGAGAFVGCSSLTELDVTAGSPYTSIDGVLYSNYMTRLVAFPAGRSGEFELPKSVTSLADGAFAGCSKLTSLMAVQDNPIVLLANSGVFDGIDFDHCELHVPLGTAFKYRHAEGWKQFKHIVDDSEVEVDGMTYSVNPDGSVTLIGADDVLTSGDYVIPTEIVVDGITYPITGIAAHAFEGCTNMITLTIPEGITYIGDHAFAGCTGLEEIYCLSPVPIDLEAMFARSFWCTRRRVAETGPNQFEGVDFEHCVLYVPQGCVEAYRNAAGWSSFVNIVEMGGTGIRLTTTDGRQDGDAYTVSGIRLSHEQLHQGNQQKGIYIINGRKVVVR